MTCVACASGTSSNVSRTTNRYRVTDAGVRTAALYSRIHSRIPGPPWPNSSGL